MERLSEFPYVWVRIGCELCSHRKGRYRLARLAAKFGSEIHLVDLIDRLAFDCRWRTRPGDRPPNQYDPKCKARFTDLEALSSPPPDLPPRSRKLTVINGGKR